MTIRWSVAMTTAPRTPSTIEASLNSLVRAGWDDPIIVAEPDSEIPRKYADFRVSWGVNQAGPYPAFRRALAALLEFARDPAPDLLMVVQDDIGITKGLRRFLDTNQDFACVIEDYASVVSLYSAGTQGHPYLPGWDVLTGKGPQRNGALALAMTPDTASRFLRETRDKIHPVGTDFHLAKWLGEHGLEYWSHWPSFVRHTGHVSSLPRPGGTPEGRQCGEWLPEIGAPPIKIPLGG